MVSFIDLKITQNINIAIFIINILFGFDIVYIISTPVHFKGALVSKIEFTLA